MHPKISFSELIFALVTTLDLVGDDDGHGKRVAQMAYQVGKQFGFKDDELHELFLAALLHDLGVSSTYVHTHLVENMEWEGVSEHCIVGASLADNAETLKFLAPYILHHHDRWDHLVELIKKGVLTEKQALFANIILIVDRVDALVWCEIVDKGYSHYHLAKESVRKQISAVWPDFFNEKIYQAFAEVSQADIFWMMNDKTEVVDFTREKLKHFKNALSIADLKEISTIFANAVDAKSEYTAMHSKGVAALAKYLAKLMKLETEQQDRVYIAGLLHDLGKLDIPDEILEKTGKLSQEDRQQMDRHSFVSYTVLKNIGGMEDIALWAAQHHEKLDGTGYPARESHLPIQSRILAVADIFQALAQKRPYRNGLALDEIMGILNGMVDDHKIDGSVVKQLNDNRVEAYNIALLKQ